MWYILIGLVVIIGFYGFNRIQSSPKNERHNIKIFKNSNLQDNPQNQLIKGSYSKKDIEDKLARLAKVPPPENLAYGAKCYKVSRPPETMHYVCPVCGSKTVYRSGKSDISNSQIIWILDRDLHKCRNIAKTIEGINITLDESEFCRKCSPNIETPQLCIKLNIAGTSDTSRVCDINASDLNLIHEFLEDELVHQGSQGYETPLKDHIDRIKQLFSIKSKE